MALEEWQKQKAAEYRARLQASVAAAHNLPPPKPRKAYTKSLSYPGNITSDLNDFIAKHLAVAVIRRKLLRFISANQHFLSTPYYIDKARRGYLQDLTNDHLAEAVREILTNKS